MTWYANYIIVEPTPAAISEFRLVPGIKNHLFLVDNIDGYDFYKEEHRHSMPSDGLLIIREVCDIEQRREWDKTVSVSWDIFKEIKDVEIIDRGEFESFYQGWEDSIPPIALLKFLKWVNVTTHSVVSYYYCSTWAGTVEEEFSWVYDKEETIYTLHDDNSTVIYQTEPSTISNKTILQLTLSHYNLYLPTNVFALCDREFNWEKYRI
ncbi:MAG: hypothetical protein IID32_02895 [Planctomycetes bacterium]|nr:hypothetical protein [Planctomycetota bacterium]